MAPQEKVYDVLHTDLNVEFAEFWIGFLAFERSVGWTDQTTSLTSASGAKLDLVLSPGGLVY
jgi:hypothetical protein